MARHLQNCKWVWRVSICVLLCFYILHWYLLCLVSKRSAGYRVRDCYGQL